MSTNAERLAKLDTERARFERRAAVEARIYSTLPPNLAAPTISNDTDDGAWLSWSASTFQQTPGSVILAALEVSGFAPLPVTLCQWENWRPSPSPGTQAEIPETKRGSFGHLDKLTDSWPIAPLWLVPCVHTGTEAHAIYRKDGQTYRVHVPGPRTVSLSAQRMEIRGDWYYKRGSAQLRYPTEWASIQLTDGTPILGINPRSRAYVDTEQGISGALYFELLTHEQDEFPLSPAALLVKLEG